jgi:hypothetical protein
VTSSGASAGLWTGLWTGAWTGVGVGLYGQVWVDPVFVFRDLGMLGLPAIVYAGFLGTSL